ncbi:class I SAM-dependent methyltransferase [Aquisalimonas asiatica]|uniref:Methyltransferase domain-containing protein n=1 Tax=Aquisalimonas asiatica TaxID=406100 RepID=A0A1H8Q0Z7_9GAMM|nr:methyltransferase domain-containing protein [Aquisalimonas asiatica]SEO47604.1 Methyltransferase domain-containing protein [Aquisalimonas asiatica]
MAVKPHHEGPARVWGLAGRDYDNISFGVGDALGHAVQRLNPGPGQDILDVATGTGWTARNVARLGARVTAVDIASGLLDAARELSGHAEPVITFRQADAEELPFADASFDGVISTFGVMFAADQRRAARELGRVCRPGGRLSLVVWEPGGSVQDFFGVIGEYDDAPPPDPSPLAWGDPAHVRDLLGDDFDLWFEPGVNHHYFDSVDDAWQWYARGFGPIKQVISQLSPDRQSAFKDAMDRYHAKFETDAGLHIRREYLVIIGRRT